MIRIRKIFIVFICFITSACFGEVKHPEKNRGNKDNKLIQSNKEDIKSFKKNYKNSSVSIINVRDFGAKGNGISDDGLAFQKAINNVKENQTLLIPKGTYLIKQTLLFNKKNVRVTGEGQSSKLIYKWGKFSRTKKLLYSFHLRDARNVTFSDFLINGGAINFDEIILDDRKDETWDVDGAYNLFLLQPNSEYSVTDIKFENLYLSNSFFDGIHSYARPADPLKKFRTKNISVRNCHFENIGSNGVGLGLVNGLLVENSTFKNMGLMKMTNVKNGGGLGIDASGGAENVVIRNNLVERAAGGIKCETHENNGGRYLPSKNISIIGNEIKNLFQGTRYDIFYGIKANGEKVVVQNNKIESNFHGILIGKDAYNVKITSNTISVEAPGFAGIRIDGNKGEYYINNNQILKSNAQGILVSDASGITIIDNIIVNCKLDNIRVVGGKNIKISNNICADSGNPNITIVPIEGLSISNVLLENNICYSMSGEQKDPEKRIFVANSNKVEILNNKILSNRGNKSNFKNTLESSPIFSNTKPSKGTFQKGDRVLKNRKNNNLDLDNVLGWECILSGSPGEWKEIKVSR